MSYKLLSRVLNGSALLSSGELVVLMVLAYHADDSGGECWPSQSTIARKGRLSERAVNNILRRLARRRLIQVVQGGPRRSSRYQIASDALGPERDSGQTRTAFRSETGTPFGSDLNPVHLRPERGSGDQSKNLSLNDKKHLDDQERALLTLTLDLLAGTIASTPSVLDDRGQPVLPTLLVAVTRIAAAERGIEWGRDGVCRVVDAAIVVWEREKEKQSELPYVARRQPKRRAS